MSPSFTDPLIKFYYHSFLIWLNNFIVTFFPLTNSHFLLSHTSLFIRFPVITPFPLMTAYCLSSLNSKTDIPGFFSFLYFPLSINCSQIGRILFGRSIKS